MHEVIHVLTSPYINQHLDEFGELKADAPSELIGLNNVLTEYKNKLMQKDVAKYEQFQNKWKKYREDRAANLPPSVEFTEEEIGVYYPTVNLKEFIATTLGNNKQFKEVAGQMEYLETGGSILKKFGSFVSQLIKRIGKTEGIQENTIALQAISKSFDLIESIQTPKKEEQTPIESAPQMSKEEMQELNEYYNNAPEFFEDDFQGGDVDYGNAPDFNDPSNDVRDENSESLLPPMKITKNKCK